MFLFQSVNLGLDLVARYVPYVAAANGCSWDLSVSNASRSQSCWLFLYVKTLIYESLSFSFNAFKWSCESSMTGPISEPAVLAQSHLLLWWKEHIHRNLNWKSIRRARMFTHTHTHQKLFYTTQTHTRRVTHTRRRVKSLIQTVHDENRCVMSCCLTYES